MDETQHRREEPEQRTLVDRAAGLLMNRSLTATTQAFTFLEEKAREGSRASADVALEILTAERQPDNGVTEQHDPPVERITHIQAAALLGCTTSGVARFVATNHLTTSAREALLDRWPHEPKSAVLPAGHGVSTPMGSEHATRRTANVDTRLPKQRDGTHAGRSSCVGAHPALRTDRHPGVDFLRIRPARMAATPTTSRPRPSKGYHPQTTNESAAPG